MNTIPVTFNEKPIQRTILGGNVQNSKIRINLSVILLSRSGSTFRTNNLEALQNFGFKQIISVEAPGINYNLEDLSQRFPQVRFIVPHYEITAGEMINLGMGEITEGYVLVLWDNMSFSTKLLTEKLVQRFIDDEKLCYVPFLANQQLQQIPIRMVPYVNKNNFATIAEILAPDNSATMYAFDFVGVYEKHKFIQLGGFDPTITSPYWQNLDFSLRAWLWGEEIRIVPLLRLQYDGFVPTEDITSNASQLRFFIKNIAPKFSLDHSYIPKIQFFSFHRHSKLSFTDALTEFKEGRRWVEQNKYRYKIDAIHLVENWENPSL